MEVANLVIGILSLVVNIIMLKKVDDVLKNIIQNNGSNNKNANQQINGKNNTSTINQ